MGGLPGCASQTIQPQRMAEGVVWQLDEQTLDLQGNWEKLGVNTLLVQWTAVNGVSYLKGGPWPTAARLPDWESIARQPWARNVILGLAGHSDEALARADFSHLVDVSARMARLPTPLNVVGWYFPVEVDSSWQAVRQLAPLLNRLPRPLWISLYDSANVGSDTLVRWLDGWLAPDIGIFFQDGVGVHARDAPTARQHADALIRSLGKARVRIIAEAFRPALKGGFRPATASELKEQLKHYAGLPAYLFDGPHYLSQALVNEMLLG